MTVLHDLLPIAIDMAKRRLTGVWNFTNPGTISHNEILQLYKQHIDASFTWNNFSLEEQAKILRAGRSNNHLGSLLSLFFAQLSQTFRSCLHSIRTFHQSTTQSSNCLCE
jgi:hypothetical protein